MKAEEMEAQKGGAGKKRKRNSSPVTGKVQKKATSSKPPSSRPKMSKNFKSKVNIFPYHQLFYSTVNDAGL